MNPPFSIPYTKTQPAHWPRDTLRNLFNRTGVPAITMSRSVDAIACPGDVLVEVSLAGIAARLIEEKETLTLGSRHSLLRPVGPMRPEILVPLLNSPSLASSIIQRDNRFNNSSLVFSWQRLKDLELAVPDLATQENMIDALRVSLGWIQEHNALIRKRTDTLEKMGNAIALEIMKGAMDKKEALLFVSKAVEPMFRLIDKDHQTPRLSAAQVAQEGQPTDEFVRLEDHLGKVARLEEKIRELRPPDPTTPALDPSPAMPASIARQGP